MVVSINKKFAVVIFLTIICLSTNLYASAQTVVSGVKAGDSFSYSISTHWSTTNSSLTNPPEYFVYNNQTKFYNITVLYVEDVNVVAMNLWEYYNDTQRLSRVDMNIDNGTVYFISGEMYFPGFFPVKLSVGDLLRPGDSNSSVCVNSAEVWDYSSGKREVNVVVVCFQVRDYSNSSIGTETTTYYIDRTSGVLVKLVDSTVFADQTGSIEWALIATNLWEVSAPTDSFFGVPVILVPVVIAIIVVVASVIFLKKRRGGKH
jgi:hypothetical protein